MESVKKLSIKHWAEEDRPREKLLDKGPSILTNAELIGILIGSGNPRTSAVDLSKQILNSVDNNLNELGKSKVNELMKFPGIGQAKAVSIVAALELGKRRKAAESMQRKKIDSSAHVFEVMYPLLADLPHEEFWVLLLNRANKLIDRFHVKS